VSLSFFCCLQIGPEQDAGQIEAQLDITSQVHLLIFRSTCIPCKNSQSTTAFHQAAVGQGIEQWFWLNQQQRWMLSFSTDFFNTVSVNC